MKGRSRAIVILSILFGYVLLQFIWWEILLVRQTSLIASERQKLVALGTADESKMQEEIDVLNRKKTTQVVMIVGEGTVFLLLLLFGVHKIRQAQERELSLTRQQNNFFLGVTHELKTPIAATRLQLQTLKKQVLDNETRDKLIEGALQENERLNALIDNVLLASRLGAGGLEVHKAKTDVTAETRHILDRYFSAALRDQKVQFASTGQVHALIDGNWYPSILINLVENALKYSGPHPKVLVEVTSGKGQAVLSVSDNGIGINDRDKKQVFQRFFRAGSEETRSSRGTGLGLYIVSSLVKQLGGSVQVRDNEPHGSRFEVFFHAA